MDPFRTVKQRTGNPFVTRHALFVALTALPALTAGCAQNGMSANPFGVLDGLVNASLSASMRVLGVQPDEGATAGPELHLNPQALEGLDAQSRRVAERNLAYTLEQGRPDVPVYWENPANRGGPTRGAATLIRESKDDEGRRCREVLVETAMEPGPADRRLLTFCRTRTGWRLVD